MRDILFKTLLNSGLFLLFFPENPQKNVPK
jgi:hypothetical protein